jgi:hypothetical protein
LPAAQEPAAKVPKTATANSSQKTVPVRIGNWRQV